MIDYIFFNRQRFLALKALELPRYVGAGAIPTDGRPSDHVPIMTELAVLPPDFNKKLHDLREAAAADRKSKLAQAQGQGQAARPPAAEIKAQPKPSSKDAN